MNLKTRLFNNRKSIYEYLWALLLYLLIAVCICMYVESTRGYNKDMVYLLVFGVTIIMRHCQWVLINWLGDGIELPKLLDESTVLSNHVEQSIENSKLTVYQKYKFKYKNRVFKLEDCPILFTVGDLNKKTLMVNIFWKVDNEISQTGYSLYAVINLFEKGTWVLLESKTN